MSITKKNKQITAKEFDEIFDKGEDITEFLDKKSAKMHYPMQRITIDFTKNILDSLDNEAERIGVTRTALIKVWVSERLEQMHMAHT